MASSSIINVLERYLTALQAASLPVESLVLYGSFARGEEQQDSDIDVLLLLHDDVASVELRDIWTQCDLVAFQIDSRIQTWPVHASRFATDEGSPLLAAARAEGVPVAA